MKKIVCIIIIALCIWGVISIGKTETESIRCCVTNCTRENADCYEITVESSKDHNLYAYYDSIPRDEGTVIVCEFTTKNEIVKAH